MSPATGRGLTRYITGVQCYTMLSMPYAHPNVAQSKLGAFWSRVWHWSSILHLVWIPDGPAKKPRKYQQTCWSLVVVMMVWQLEIFTLVVLVMKEFLNFLLRSRPWLTIISTIARDMGVSVFLMRQVVHEGIRYFSYEMKKGKILTQRDKEKKN